MIVFIWHYVAVLFFSLFGFVSVAACGGPVTVGVAKGCKKVVILKAQWKRVAC